jgi:hypothetical protein
LASGALCFAGEECSTKPKENITEAPSELPGKKKYIPPYTPKSALDNVRNNPAPKPSPSSVKFASGSSASKPGSSARHSSSSSRSSQSGLGAHRMPGSSKKRGKARNSEDELDVESEFFLFCPVKGPML